MMQKNMRKICKTDYHSKRLGILPRGCRQCVQGRKTVLFVTGLCSKQCFFCPISDDKYNQDVVYANEWPISSIKDIIAEIRLCSSKGVGITGGDPLVKLDRTIKYIKALKKEFGKQFHTHLYTPLILVTENKLKKLFDAGLDEIRFHPDLDDKTNWHGLTLAEKFSWDVGVEIPVIPGKKKTTIELIEFIKDKIDFLNLNELEISDTNASRLLEKGFVPKNRTSYGVKGSEKMANELLKYCREKTRLRVHYCTTRLKDKVQLAKRIKLRAENTAYEFDKITGDGTLIRGVIYTKDLAPGFGYHNKLNKINKNIINKKLKKLKTQLNEELSISEELLQIDEVKPRLLTSIEIVMQYCDKIKNYNLVPAIVEEYPTYDGMEVEIEFL